MKSKSIFLKGESGETTLHKLWFNQSVTIICVRHLESKVCFQEIKKTLSKIPFPDSSQKLIIIFASGNSESYKTWRDGLGMDFSFYRDPERECFKYFGFYSGIVRFEAGGLLTHKIALELLSAIPSKPYKFLSDIQELKPLSKM